MCGEGCAQFYNISGHQKGMKLRNIWKKRLITASSRHERLEKAPDGSIEGNGTWDWMAGVQRQTEDSQHGHTPTIPSLAPLPFLSGNSNPVPPEGYKETSVGTGQLLAVSSVISYICPSIGCRCQFRPNRCMAVVSNEKSHLFLFGRVQNYRSPF